MLMKKKTRFKNKVYSLPLLVFILMLISSVGPLLIIVIYEFIRFHENFFIKGDPVLMVFVVSIFFTLAFIGFIVNNITVPIEKLIESIKEYRCKKNKPQNKIFSRIKEFNYLSAEFQHLVYEINHYQSELIQKTRLAAIGETAKMVAHDIRSPLSCLSLLLTETKTLPEETRTLMYTAVQRISDIANTLETKSKITCDINNTLKDKKNDKHECVMISALIDSLVSEKRMQYRNKGNIKIDLSVEKSYGLFTRINSAQFKRVISNIIDNSVEAFDDNSHHVSITIERIAKFIQIIIYDDGKGIPEKILANVGKQGFSYGKPSGSGFGLFHAIEKIRSFGGSFAINSKKQQGTAVTIKLPQNEVPTWFVEKLNLKNIQAIIILDDDQSIHNLWRGKFSKLTNNNNIKLTYFTDSEQFYECYSKINKNSFMNTLFLMDFELINQKHTGIDLIEALDIAKYTILVTSYYEDKNILEKVGKLNVKMIPKGIAGFISIT